MLPNVGMGELAVLVLVALLVFGPKRLPEMMRSAGKAFRSFQAETQKAAAELKEAVDTSEINTGFAESVIFDHPDEQALRRQQAEVSKEAPAKEATPAKKKAAVKKPVAKKPVAKKPVAKKPAAKKPAAKKKTVATKTTAGVYPVTEDT